MAARPGRQSRTRPDPDQGEDGEGEPDEQVLRAEHRGESKEQAGEEPPGPGTTRRGVGEAVRGPEERQHRGGQRQHRRRLAVEGADRVDERWIDRDAKGGEQPGGPAGDAAAEQVDDEDRAQAEQQLDDAGGAFAGARGGVEAGGVEQRSAG